MLRVSSLLVLVLVVGGLAFGCDGDPVPTDAARPPDATSDDASAEDGGAEDAAIDLDAATEDASLGDDAPLDARREPDALGEDAYWPDVFVGTDAWSPIPDTGPSTPDAFAPRDVGTDAGGRTDLGPVQCTPALECPAGAGLCNDTAPGGVCSCFLGTESCPTGTSCDTEIGACVRSCRSDLDCSAGMGCSSLTSRCQILRCSSTTPCPAPYVCSSAASGFCRRPSCAGGVPCPSSMTCVSEVCVED